MELTIPQAADRLNVTRQWIHKLVIDKRIRARKVGRDYLIRVSDLERFNAKPRAKGGRPKRVLCARCNGELTSADAEMKACSQCGHSLKG